MNLVTWQGAYKICNDIYINTIANMDPHQDTIEQREMYHGYFLMMIPLDRNLQQLQNNEQMLIQYYWFIWGLLWRRPYNNTTQWNTIGCTCKPVLPTSTRKCSFLTTHSHSECMSKQITDGVGKQLQTPTYLTWLDKHKASKNYVWIIMLSEFELDVPSDGSALKRRFLENRVFRDFRA
jgi:hypothetical protein